MNDPGDNDTNDTGHDIVLSREDYELLHAFHRLIPLPALSSGITRLLCDEDLQVPDDDVDCTSSTAATPSMKKHTSHVETMRQLREPPTKPRQETDLTKLTTRRQPEQLRPESS